MAANKILYTAFQLLAPSLLVDLDAKAASPGGHPDGAADCNANAQKNQDGKEPLVLIFFPPGLVIFWGA